MFIRDEEPNKEVAILYAKFSHELLQTAGGELGAKLLAGTYRKKLLELGFGRKSVISRTDVINEIANFYGKDLLSLMDTAYRKGRTSSWLHHAMEISTFDVPLNRHLIVAYYLFREVDKFWRAVELEKENVNSIKTSKDINNKVVNKRARGKSKYAANGYSIPKLKVKAVLELLHDIKEEHPEYTLSDFWNYHFGLMKRFVRISQDEFQKFRLALESGESTFKGNREMPPDCRKNKHIQQDKIAADKIERIAISLFASYEKPVKVTKNAILKMAGLTSKINSKPDLFPLSIEKLNLYAESDWHFYARRIIWSKLKLGTPADAPANIILPAGVHFARGLVLLDYFKNVDITKKLRTDTIVGILVEYGIGKNWVGPCPERKFTCYGRGYVKKSKEDTNNIMCNQTSGKDLFVQEKKIKEVSQTGAYKGIELTPHHMKIKVAY